MSEQKKQQSASTQEAIALLQATIQQLESIVHKLSTESATQLPSPEVIQTLVKDTQKLTEAFTNQESPPAAHSLDDILPSFNSVESFWDRVLASLRSVLPVSWRDRVSDWALTSVLTIMVIGLLLGGVLLFSSSPTEVAETLPPPLTNTDNRELSPSPTPTVIETPPFIEAPGLPEPVELKPPQPLLTPEQSLIAAIQEQLTELTQQYPASLIMRIEANFGESRLIVTLGQEWYTLKTARQNSLANVILERSQSLDFRKLELVSEQGDLIARSPVVGSEMVILRPTPSND